jgi:hypothetical protein
MYVCKCYYGQVFDRFDRRGGGSIDYMNFLELIGFAPTRASSAPSSSSSEETNLLVEKIRRKLEDYAGSGQKKLVIHSHSLIYSNKYVLTVHAYIHTYIHTYMRIMQMYPAIVLYSCLAGLGSQSAGRIKAIFAEIDSDNSGTIDQGEFAKAMKILRADLTSREIQAVLKVLILDRFYYANE